MVKSGVLLCSLQNWCLVLEGNVNVVIVELKSEWVVHLAEWVIHLIEWVGLLAVNL